MEGVGSQIRAQREARELSVRGLARVLGVSPSLISQIEHGKATPSVATLYGIVSELGISLDELFFTVEKENPGRAGNGGPAVVQRADAQAPIAWEAPSEGPVLREENRLKLRLGTGVRWERLTASQDPRIDFLYVTYPVGAESCPPDVLMRHRGSEYGVVLTGRLGATIGEESYELDPGDSIAFESTEPHRIWAIGEEAATAIWVVMGREGDPRVG